jgi:hypothetical protein
MAFHSPPWRAKERGVRILFAAREENREHTERLGEFLPVPVTGPEIVAAARRMLSEDRRGSRIFILAVGRWRN